jgi:hypothetical protein
MFSVAAVGPQWYFNTFLGEVTVAGRVCEQWQNYMGDEVLTIDPTNCLPLFETGPLNAFDLVWGGLFYVNTTSAEPPSFVFDAPAICW